MNNRVLQVQMAFLQEIEKYAELVVERDQPPQWECVHMASSARLAWIMGMERGVDPELAACACSIHDYGRIVTGKQAGHAEAGYEPVQRFLKRLGTLFSPEEQEIMAQAVKNHSSKSVVGTPVEEIVKDADVVDCYQYGLPLQREEQKKRYAVWIEKQ